MYAVDILDQKDTEFSNILLYNVGQNVDGSEGAF